MCAGGSSGGRYQVEARYQVKASPLLSNQSTSSCACWQSDAGGGGSGGGGGGGGDGSGGGGGGVGALKGLEELSLEDLLSEQGVAAERIDALNCWNLPAQVTPETLHVDLYIHPYI